jgi:hypothetical protein
MSGIFPDYLAPIVRIRPEGRELMLVRLGNPDTSRHRVRFSTGHELGHWHHHRGQSFVCRSSDIGRPVDEKSKDAERLADAYSGDLILPPFMIRPRLERQGEISLEGITEVAGQFDASVTATAIRTVKITRQPLLLVAHNLLGRKWQWPSLAVGDMRVREDIDTRSSAFACIAGGRRGSAAKKEPAHYWFDRRHVEQFDVRVQSHRTTEGEVLTLLRVLDLRMVAIYG